jgi:hypothetical protein
MGIGISTGHDPGTMNGRAILYAQISPIPVSNGVGLGTISWMSRIKALYLDLTVRIDETSPVSEGSVSARR